VGISLELAECGLTLEEPRSCLDFESSIDGALFEMKQIYQERVPYALSEQIDGLCVKFDEVFILLCRYAMSTDCMDNFSPDERRIWRNFVSFEEAFTYAATTDNCDGKPDGATDYRKDEFLGVTYEGSYPVQLVDMPEFTFKYLDLESNSWKWAVKPVTPAVPEFCYLERAQDPVMDVTKAYVYDSLDDIFANIHDCKPYNDCDCKDYELMINDCNNPNNPIGPEDIYLTGCGEGYCEIGVGSSAPRNGKKRRR
jgi:hypothetical protein